MKDLRSLRQMNNSPSIALQSALSSKKHSAVPFKKSHSRAIKTKLDLRNNKVTMTPQQNPLRANLQFFLRLFFYLSVPLLLLLHYWSSLTKEEFMLRSLRKAEQIEHRLEQLEIAQKKEAVRNKDAASFEEFEELNEGKKEEKKKSEGAQEQSLFYPNLLEEDPFIKETLPKLLGKDFRVENTQRRALIGRPEHLHPFSITATVSQLWDLSTRWMGRSHVGFPEKIAPSLAKRIEARPRQGQQDLSHRASLREGEFWVFMRDDIYWQPINAMTLSPELEISPHFLTPHLVTAWDVKFYFDVIMNPYVQTPSALAQRELYQDVEELRVIDDHTFVVKWKLKEVAQEDGTSQKLMRANALQFVAGLRALARFVYQYEPSGRKILDEGDDPDCYRTSYIWAQVFLHHWSEQTIVSCGDWVLEASYPRELLFKRNPFVRDGSGPLNTYLHYTLRDSSSAAWHEFKNNKIDLYRLDPLLNLEKERFISSSKYQKQLQTPGNAIQEYQYEQPAFFFIGWNCQRPLFREAGVRRALTMAINRDQIVRQYFNREAVTIQGPFKRSSPSTDPNLPPIRYDPLLAKQELLRLGWSEVENFLQKDGKPFAFLLTYNVKSTKAQLVAEGIADQLRQIGIACQIQGLDWGDLQQQLNDKEFDAYIGGYTQGSFPENIRQLWHSQSALRKGSSNSVGFINERIDEIIERVEYLFDREEKIALYREFAAILAREQPFTFLYTPTVTLLARERLRNIIIPSKEPTLLPGALDGEPQERLFYVQTPMI